MSRLEFFEHELASFERDEHGMTLEPLDSIGRWRRFRLAAPGGTPIKPREAIFYVSVENVDEPTEAELHALADECRKAREALQQEAVAT